MDDTIGTRTEGGDTGAERLPRGKDELDFLDSRKDSTPLGPDTAREKALAFTRVAVKNDAEAGGRAHDEGELAVEAYVRHVDAVLNEKSFTTLLRKTHPRHPATVFRNMRIAKAFTREEAVRWGATKCGLALQLVDALGLIPPTTEERSTAQRVALKKLLGTTLRLPDWAGGGTTKFPDTVERLRAALWFLQNPRVDDEPTETGGRKLLRTRSWLAAKCEEDAEIAALQPRAHLDEGEVSVRTNARGRSGAAAAARLYAELAKRR